MGSPASLTRLLSLLQRCLVGLPPLQRKRDRETDGERKKQDASIGRLHLCGLFEFRDSANQWSSFTSCSWRLCSCVEQSAGQLQDG